MKPISRNDPLLVLQSTQRTPDQIVNAATAYANIRWRFEDKLRTTLAGANYLQEQTVHQTPGEMLLISPTYNLKSG